MTEQIINIDRMEQAVALFGTFDENIRMIQNEYMVSGIVIDDMNIKYNFSHWVLYQATVS